MTTLPRPKRRRAYVGVVALSAAAVLGVAGCGGDDSSTGAEPGSVASFIPSTAPMYFEVSTEFDGPQWTQAKALAAKFPSFPDIEKKFAEGVSSEGVSWEKDIRPLLGTDAALAVLEVPKTKVPAVPDLSKGGDSAAESIGALAGSAPDLNDQKVLGALALAPDSEEKVLELIKKEGTVASKVGDVDIYKNTEGDSFVAVADGALLVAMTEADLKASLDAHAQGGNRVFSGNTKALDVLEKLPDEVLMQVYVDAGAIVKQGVGDNAQLKQLEALGLSVDAAAGMSLSAEAGGIRVKGVTVGDNSELLAKSTSFSPTLTANVPGDAVAYVGFSNLAGTAENVLATVSASNPDIAKQLQAGAGSLPLLLGGATLDDVKALATGEHALVVTAGTPAPGASLLLGVEDGAKAKKTLDAIANALPLVAGQLGQAGTDLPEWKDITEAGNAGRQLPIDPRAGVNYGVKGNLAVVGTQASALGLLNTPATALAQDADFLAATEAVPDEVTALAWVDIAAAVDAADALGAFKADDAKAKEARANLEPLDYMVMWATISDGNPTVEAFVAVK
jgi:Protein of unknown function (DUF3352)